MIRDEQIKGLTAIITDLRASFEQINADDLICNLTEYGCDCFDAWYRFPSARGRVVGRIQNDNGTRFGNIISECIEDASSVFDYGTPRCDAMIARLITRFIIFNDFAI